MLNVLPGVYAKNGEPVNIKPVCHASIGSSLEMTFRGDDHQLLDYSEN